MPLGLGDFSGHWILARDITDHRAGLDMSLEGQAVFSPVSLGLRCDESGIMQARGQVPGQAPMQTSRRTFWCSEGPEIVVTFDDGRAFHRFTPNTPEPKATHDCPPDTYEVLYDFSNWPQWSAIWQVCGPRKDYRMVSRYRR